MNKRMTRLGILPSAPTGDGVHQRFHAGDFGFGRDPVAQIENMSREAAHGFEQAGGFGGDDLGGGLHEHGVEVALDGDIGVEIASGDGDLDNAAILRELDRGRDDPVATVEVPE